MTKITILATINAIYNNISKMLILNIAFFSHIKKVSVKSKKEITVENLQIKIRTLKTNIKNSTKM